MTGCRRIARVFLFALLTAAWGLESGCRCLPTPTSEDIPTNKHLGISTHIPKQPGRFTVWQKINPFWLFGNADEPIPPAWYRPGGRFRTFLWHLRNPCHNFACYGIGLSDKPFTVTGLFPDNTFNPHGGWNWAVCRYHFLRLPFISYAHHRFKFYFGWRTGGAFGIELKFGSKEVFP